MEHETEIAVCYFAGCLRGMLAVHFTPGNNPPGWPISRRLMSLYAAAVYRVATRALGAWYSSDVLSVINIQWRAMLRLQCLQTSCV